jgi:hypothetical protein
VSDTRTKPAAPTLGYTLRPMLRRVVAPHPRRMFDDELLDGIIRLLMRIDANVQALLDAVTEEDDGDDEESDS